MHRRDVLRAGLALPLACAWAPAWAGDQIPIADMHFHLFFPGTIPGRNGPIKPLRTTMLEGGVTLLSWSLVGDMQWLRPTPRGLRQNGVPEPGAARHWFEAELQRIRAHLAAQGLKLVREPADIEQALNGEPHVVLSVEGATFLDEDSAYLERAYDLGIRHIQLVHYIRNELGDFQTEKPEHAGLTARGRAVVEACNRLGILIDLAHATPAVVEQTLAISKAPVVWSHSAIARGAKPNFAMAAVQARQLEPGVAKAIAAKGGVVGLWALRSGSVHSVDGYAHEVARMADMLGEDHVGFGTDTGALSHPVIGTYRDLRHVLDVWLASGMPRERAHKLAIGNYARVLKQVMGARAA